MIHSVSFASEGPPHDKGLPLASSVLEEWGKLCLLGGADSYQGYTPRRIIDEDPEDAWAVQCYGDEHRMDENRGYHKIGLGAWRAAIFNKAMKSAVDGDTIVVHCSNFHNYPCMRQFASRMKDYVETVMSFTDLYSPPHDHVAMYCASEIFDLIDDVEFREDISHAPMGRCRLIIAKVNARTRAFSQLFEDTVKKNPLLLSPLKKTGYPRGGFHHHTAEQGIYNILAFREGLFPREWETSWMMPLRQAGIAPASGLQQVIKYAAPHLTEKEEKWRNIIKLARQSYDEGHPAVGDTETMRALSLFPQRSEPLYHACQWYRFQGKNHDSYRFYELGVVLPFYIENASTCCNPGAWEWAVELSIISYYVKEKKDFLNFLLLADKAIKRLVPDYQVENLLFNLPFYTDPLPFPKTDLQVPKITSYFNSTPCIITVPGRGIVTLVRHVDYHMQSRKLNDSILPMNGSISSTSSIKIGDGSWKQVKVIDDKLVRDPRSYYKGIEDIRLFIEPVTGSIKGLGTVYEYTKDFKGTICVLDVDLDNAVITPIRLLPRIGEAEKNHSPILGTNLFLYSWSPRICIYDINNPSLFIYESDDIPVIFKRMRGSTAGVPYPSGSSPAESYWFLTHSKSNSDPWTFFSYVVVICAKTFKLLSYSIPFFFEAEQVEFTCGFTFVNDDGIQSLLIGYSTMDQTSKTVKVPVDWIKERLIHRS